MITAQVGFSRSTAVVVAGAFFMENLDATIIQTAIPAIARDFGVAPIDVNVALLSYLLAVSIDIPASGWIADRFGVRPVFIGAVGIFTIASLWCGFAPDLASLTIARAAQGLGGALMVPVGRLAVLRTAKPTELLAAVAYLTWPALVAPVVAPALGGIISDTIGWRFIFFINVPLGLIAIAAGIALFDRPRQRAVQRLDLAGFAALASSLTALTIGAEMLSDDSPAAVIGAFLLAIGIAGVAWTIRRMRRRPHPLLEWTALHVDTFRVGNVSGGVYRLMISSAPLLWALLFQVGYGWSATTAGLVLMAVFAGNLAIKPATTRIIRGLGFRTTLLWSTLAGAALLATFTVLDASTPLFVIISLLFASGVFRSIGFSAYNTLQFVDIEPTALGGANTLSSTIQQTATVLGIAVATLALRLGTVAAEVTIGSPDAGYRWCFAVAAAIMLVPFIGALRLARDAGSTALARQVAS